MPYVLVASQHAEHLSRGIMRLLRPAHLRGEGWTDLYCGVLRHPVTGEAALDLPDTEQVPIHVEATGEDLAAVLSVFVADGAITPTEAAGIGQAVGASAGSLARIADFVPPSWQANVRTRAQMNAGGWFPSSPW